MSINKDTTPEDKDSSTSDQSESPVTKPKRSRVEWSFPRASLAKAVEIPQALREHNGGNPWPPADVARAIKLAGRSTTFFYQSSTAQKFGLTTGARDAKLISLTELGKKIVSPINEEEKESALRAAFEKVELFSRVYNYYQGYDLPKPEFLANTLEREFGLAPATHGEFTEVFIESCEYAMLPKSNSKGSNLLASHEKNDIESTTITYASNTNDKRPTCFVIMPFTEKTNEYPDGFFTEVLNSLLIPAGNMAGFKVETARKQGSDVIQATILKELLASDLVVADLTSHNPNVLFELGLRIHANKPVALIRAVGTPAIFDVDNLMRVLEYDRTLWKSVIEKDVTRLAEHIKGAWSNREDPHTYKSILLGPN